MRVEAYKLMEEHSDTYWWYCARREIIVDVISRFMGKGTSIVDYGCGSGSMAKSLREFGYRVVAADINQGALAACRAAGLETVDLCQKSLPQGQARGILLADVLEHVENDVGMLMDMRHALSKDGHIIVTVPAYEFLFGGEDFVSNHVRRYTRKQLVAVIKSAGFTPVWASYFNFFLFPAIASVILKGRIFQPRTMYESNIKPLRSWVNSFLYEVFHLERSILRFLRFPFGASIIAVARLAEANGSVVDQTPITVINSEGLD